MHSRPCSAARLAACEELKVHTVHWGQHWRITLRQLACRMFRSTRMWSWVTGQVVSNVSSDCMPSSSAWRSSIVLLGPQDEGTTIPWNIRTVHPVIQRHISADGIFSNTAVRTLNLAAICFRSMKYKLSLCSRPSCIMKLDVLLKERDVP